MARSQQYEPPLREERARSRRPPLRRVREGRILGGVAAGIAEHLGVAPAVVRLFLVVSAFAAGFGIVVYALLWILAPPDDGRPVAAAPLPLTPPRTTGGQLAGVGLVVAGVLVLLAVGGLWFGSVQGWPIILAAIGFAVVWARSGDDGRSGWELSRMSGPMHAIVSGPVSLPRLAIGAVLIAASGGVLLANTSLSTAGNTLLAIAVAVVGVGLLAGPWMWRLANQLMEERASRVRADARAEVAAHLHDSVLQTLALIQRAHEPREMASLARTQERELRAWLYGQAQGATVAGLRHAMDETAGRIEAQHRVRVDAVTVGDAPLDERLQALVAAVAEATANAARHSGADSVAVYVEVEPGMVTAFVRDKGTGFDVADVPADRHGIRQSIVGRLARHGGTAQVSSGPGGTEVTLRLPRTGA